MLDNFGIVGRALAEAAVGSVGVVVLDVLGEELFELSAVPDEGAVAEFAAYGADPAFRVGVRDRRGGRGANDRRTVTAEDFIECANELAGAVADQEPDRAVLAHREIAGGLRGPGAGRGLGHAGEVHEACVEFETSWREAAFGLSPMLSGWCGAQA